jgi:glycosyltransferase involved in cell wall biosynthesis
MKTIDNCLRQRAFLSMSQAPMKLLFAIKTLDSVAGGAEKVFSQVSSQLAERGHSVSVVTFDKPGAAPFYPLHRNIRKIDLGIGNPAQKSTFFETVKRICALRALIKAERPDLVVAFMHSMFVPASLAALGTGIPVIASEHTVPEHYKGRMFEFLTLLLSCVLTKKMTVVSEDIRQRYPGYFKTKMYTLPNPVEAPKPGDGEAVSVSLRPHILNVGRLDPKKDHETLLRAFAKIALDYPSWDLKIVGDGPMRSSLETLIKDLALQDRAFLMGAINDISDFYRNACFFVTASRYESLGISTLEAMAYGLPAVGFQDCPGTNKIIRDGYNGLLVSPDDRSTNLAAAMAHLMGSEAQLQSFSENARLTAQEYQSCDVYAAWETFLRSNI